MRNLIFLPLLFTTSCFSLGIPEVYLQNTKRPEISIETSIAVASSAKESFEAAHSGLEQEFLGSQYILGLFPFTRLYFQHGIRAQVVESYLEQNFNSLIVSKKAANRFPVALEILPPKLSVNAYDFLFFRRLSIQGEVRAKLKRNYLSDEVSLSVSVSEVRYLKSAHLPRISLIVEEAILHATKRLATEVEEKIRKRQLTKWLFTNKIPSNIYYISKPSIELAKPQLEEIKKQVISSYGPGSEILYPKIDIGRLLQRGIEVAFSNERVPHFSSVGNLSYPNRIETKVLELALYKDKLLLKVQISLFSNGRMLNRKLHMVQQTLADESDAGWFFTLQAAGKELADKFLMNGKTKNPV